MVKVTLLCFEPELSLKMDSVPVALLVMVPTATGFYWSVLFSRSQVLYGGNCNSLCTEHMFSALLGFIFRGKFA